MKPIFLDTSFVLAVQVADDANHPRAIEFWNELANVGPILVTTSFVVDEVATMLTAEALMQLQWR